MRMTPFVRKLALIAHIVSSIGWIGAVAVYIALAVAILIRQDVSFVRGAYFAMELAVWFVIVPLSLASFLTGLILSLGTVWGLFRHYWVIFKLFLNVFAVVVLLMYTESIGSFADIAARDPLSNAELSALRDPTHLIHSGGALFVLLVATILAVYKPRGMTQYGRRKQFAERKPLVP